MTMVKMIVTMWQLQGQIVKVETNCHHFLYGCVHAHGSKWLEKQKIKKPSYQTDKIFLNGDIFITQEDSYDSYNNDSLQKSDIAAKKNDWQL
jgi:hypothetical protein